MRARSTALASLVTLDIPTPAGFSFANLYPALPPHVTGRDDAYTGDKMTEPHFLQRLSLGACRLIFSNRAYRDETLACDFAPGLNFAGELYFMGLLFPLRFGRKVEYLAPRNPGLV